MIRAASIGHSESFNSRTNELHDLDDVYRKYKKLTHDWELSVKEKIRALARGAGDYKQDSCML